MHLLRQVCLFDISLLRMIFIKVFIVIFQIFMRLVIVLLLTIFKFHFQAFLQVLDLLLASQKHQNASWRQVLVNLDYFFESLFSIILFGCLVVMCRDRKLSCINLNHARGLLIKIRGKEALVLPKV